MRIRLLAVLSIALAPAVLAACASSRSLRAEEQLEAPSVLTVENQRTDDATIYVYRAGVKTRRLGKVGSLSSATFALVESDGAAGSEFQLAAIAFANGWVDVSDPATVARSAHYHWQLAPARGQQFLSIHYAAADGTSARSPYNGDRLPGNATSRGAQ